MRYFVFVGSLILFGLIGCNDDKTVNKEPVTELTVGTFNIQFLGDTAHAGENPRSKDDYAQLARLINENGLQIMAVEELASEDSLTRLQENGLSSNWEIVLGESGGTQHVGIIYDKSVIESVDLVQELGEDDGFNEGDWKNVRFPLKGVVTVRGGYTFIIVALHLKAGITESSLYQRQRQTTQLAQWANNLELPFVFMGDFNDTLEGIDDNIKTLDPLKDATSVGSFLSSEIEDYTSLQFYDLIDHVFVSQEIKSIYKQGTIETIKFDKDASYDGAVISDHRPVKFKLTLPVE